MIAGWLQLLIVVAIGFGLVKGLRRKSACGDQSLCKGKPKGLLLAVLIGGVLLSMIATRNKPFETEREATQQGVAAPYAPHYYPSHEHAGEVERLQSEWERLSANKIELHAERATPVQERKKPIQAAAVSEPVVAEQAPAPIPPAPISPAPQAAATDAELNRAAAQFLATLIKTADAASEKPDDKSSGNKTADPSSADSSALSRALSALIGSAEQLKSLVAAKASADSSKPGSKSATSPATGRIADPASVATALNSKAAAHELPLEVEELSFPLEDVAAAPKPEWIYSTDTLVDDAREQVIATDPYATIDECRRSLAEKLEAIVLQRLRSLAAANVGTAYAKIPGSLNDLFISRADLLDRIYRGSYVETIDASVGEMKKAYMLVNFDQQADQWLVESWKRYSRRAGVEQVGVVASMVLSGLGLAYSLLKVDSWTRGYYTKRLFIGVPAAIIALGVILANTLS